LYHGAGNVTAKPRSAAKAEAIFGIPPAGSRCSRKFRRLLEQLVKDLIGTPSLGGSEGKASLLVAGKRCRGFVAASGDLRPFRLPP